MMDLKGKKGFKVYNVIVIPLSEDVKKRTTPHGAVPQNYFYDKYKFYSPYCFSKSF